MSEIYLWVKAFHIMAVMSWMAGLFYLPRLFVYHVEQVETGSPTDKMFQTMEYRLLKAIMNPAMIVTWILGLILVVTPGLVDWSDTWPWVKGFCVIAMTIFHIWLGKKRKDFVAGVNVLTGRQYRVMNEAPTLLMIAIVLSVILKF
ncbi:MAG TPA: protoporphyrinogen oxidase HemJ [Rhodobacter sp.]|jgi:putative membrane protein|nr:protoporphyrinogen oxidase HemJ [Paracoccaceae bacterium]MDO7733185.1 protoporphyrinogen oxidase HemJ [Paracoccaceae bacterium]HAQ46175.1 protoporphyrinogen oxidase HemJ [Rhodobacter sp.]HCM98953.1 protoporphyrinogen oxidase HemJ [Rhodobacter sp.]